MIRFACPQCGKGFQVEDKAAGKKTKCPKCMAAITIPLAEAIQTSAPAQPVPAVAPPAAVPAKKAFDEVYGLASEPPRPPANLSEDQPWNTAAGQSPLGSMGTRDRTTSPRGSKNRGPSLVYVALGGVLLTGITVGATLWATGSLQKLHSADTSAAQVPSAQVPNTNAQEQQSNKAKVNLAIFDPVHRVVTELRAAQDVGMNREKFQGLLQQFSAEVIIATEKVQSPAEKEIAEGYSQVLAIYKDSGKIWDVKMEIPSLKYNADSYSEMMLKKMNDEAKNAPTQNYHFQLAIIDGIPLDVYPKGGTGLDEIVNRYSIPVEKKEEYRIISESSIQLLWEKAGEKMEEVTEMTTGYKPVGSGENRGYGLKSFAHDLVT